MNNRNQHSQSGSDRYRDQPGRRNYGRDSFGRYGRSGRDIERGFGRGYSQESGRAYEQDFDRDYGQDFNRGYGQNFGSGYGPDFGRDDDWNTERDFGQNYDWNSDRPPGRDQNWGSNRDFGRNQDWNADPGSDRSFGSSDRYSDRNFGRRNVDRNYDESGNRSFYQGSRQSQNLFGRGPHAGKGPKGFQRSAESLKEQVCARLESDGALDASEIEVEVKNCEVTLTGKVCSREEKREAEQCAESVNGIKDVHNRLTVDPSIGAQSQQQKDDNRSAHTRGSKS